MDFKEMLRKVLYAEGEARTELARNAFEKIKVEATKFGITEENAELFSAALIRLFVQADRTVSIEEYTFLCSVLNFNLSFREFEDVMKQPETDQFVASMDALIDHFSPEAKEAVCLFGLCIMESDDVLGTAEQKLFERLMK